jgi:phosphoribosylanthranilate isomerase
MWIKICGIRDVDTARQLVKLGADAIGLNFYAPSPRSVAVKPAAEIAECVRGQLLPIGLFVNHSLVEIRQISQECGLTTIQLHGDETPEFLAELQEFRILKAFRLGPDGLLPVVEYLQRCERLGVKLSACLIDAAVPGHFGGSGVTVDWNQLAAEYQTELHPPLILAGGLTANNVAKSIHVVRPWGVDVASGVESSKGVKDLLLVKQFIEAARG